MAELNQIETDGINAVITALENKNCELVSHTGFTRKGDSKRIHTIQYAPLDQNDSNVINDIKICYLIESNGVMKFFGEKPEILKDTPQTSPPSRSQYIPDSVLKDQYEARFTDHSIINLDVSVIESPDSMDYDLVNLEVNDSSNGVIKYPRIKIWEKNDGGYDWQLLPS